MCIDMVCTAIVEQQQHFALLHAHLLVEVSEPLAEVVSRHPCLGVVCIRYCIDRTLAKPRGFVALPMTNSFSESSMFAHTNTVMRFLLFFPPRIYPSSPRRFLLAVTEKIAPFRQRYTCPCRRMSQECGCCASPSNAGDHPRQRTQLHRQCFYM